MAAHLLHVDYKYYTDEQILTMVTKTLGQLDTCFLQAAKIALERQRLPRLDIPIFESKECRTNEFTYHRHCQGCHLKRPVKGHPTQKGVFHTWFLCVRPKYRSWPGCRKCCGGPTISILRCIGCRQVHKTSSGFPFTFDEEKLLAESPAGTLFYTWQAIQTQQLHWVESILIQSHPYNEDGARILTAMD